MALNDAHLNARHTGQTITWTRLDGTPETLTGATVTGRMVRADGSGTARAIAGTLTVTDGANGVFTWAYAAGDVSEAGMFKVQFKATFGDSTYDLTYETTFHVRQAV